MNCGAFFYCFQRRYQLDREIVLSCISKDICGVTLLAYPLIFHDRVLAMRIVKQDGLCLGALPLKYQNDREIVSLAIQQNKKAFKFASDELQNDLQLLKLYNNLQ